MDNVSLQAYKFIKENGINTLPITLDDLFSIVKNNNWHIGSYNQTTGLQKELKSQGFNIDKYIDTKDAFVVIFHNEYTIFYKDTLALDYKIFVIIHEFGHIVLKHTYHGILGISHTEEQTNAQEAEANAFAREVCAPIPVIYRLNLKSEKDIERFGFLQNKYASEQFLKLNNVNCNYCFSAIEKDIFKIFKKFIRNIRISNIFSSVKRHAPVTLAVALICAMLTVPFVQYKQILIHKPSQLTVEQSENISRDTKRQTNSANIATQNDTVYVTRSGDKYHVEGCMYIKNKTNLKSMSEANAIRMEYQPCSVCGK